MKCVDVDEKGLNNVAFHTRILFPPPKKNVFTNKCIWLRMFMHDACWEGPWHEAQMIILFEFWKITLFSSSLSLRKVCTLWELFNWYYLFWNQNNISIFWVNF